MEFHFDKIQSNVSGLIQLAKLENQSHNLFFDDLVLNFSKVSWFNAHLSALLGAILTKVSENINEIHWSSLSPGVEEILQKNNFISHFGGNSQSDRYHTTVPYQKFKPNEIQKFKLYIDDNLFSMKDLPKMSEALKKDILKSILEIFNNASTHSNCKFIFCCGQYYPTKKYIVFSIANLGRTIYTNVSNHLKKNISPSNSIDWAVREGNTTRTGNVPGGLGLSILQKFLKKNNGRLEIYSENGYWTLTEKRDLEESLRGTIVNLSFNVNVF